VYFAIGPMSATPVRYYQSVGGSSFAAVGRDKKKVGRDKKKSSSESYFNGDIDYV
jgi:hypothetical protein